MKQRVSLLTLGVADTARAREFYGALGWQGTSPDGDVVFYDAGGTVFSIWGRDDLAKDSAVQDGGGWGGVTLAVNVPSSDQVDAVIEEARAAGATIAREPGETFYGGYSGVFHDPDGHPWEIAYNPGFPLDDDGAVVLPQFDK
ncbi:MAG TPA: VOC family protein [Baekduia sp.]|nr:VOC family protein [Baekduia sp.]